MPASTVRLSLSSALQRSASTYFFKSSSSPWLDWASLSTGPWRLSRTGSTRSGWPLIWMVSSRWLKVPQARWPSTSGRRYCCGLAGLICSRYRSCTSGPVLVKPQATLLVRPSTTNGRPGSVAPITSSAGTLLPSGARDAGACSRAKYQMAGALRPRCGSFANSGLPLVLCEPATTQLLLPLPSTVPALWFQSVAQSRRFCAESESKMPAAGIG